MQTAELQLSLISLLKSVVEAFQNKLAGTTAGVLIDNIGLFNFCAVSNHIIDLH